MNVLIQRQGTILIYGMYRVYRKTALKSRDDNYSNHYACRTNSDIIQDNTYKFYALAFKRNHPYCWRYHQISKLHWFLTGFVYICWLREAKRLKIVSDDSVIWEENISNFSKKKLAHKRDSLEYSQKTKNTRFIENFVTPKQDDGWTKAVHDSSFKAQWLRSTSTESD